MSKLGVWRGLLSLLTRWIPALWRPFGGCDANLSDEGWLGLNAPATDSPRLLKQVSHTFDKFMTRSYLQLVCSATPFLLSKTASSQLHCEHGNPCSYSAKPWWSRHKKNPTVPLLRLPWPLLLHPHLSLSRVHVLWGNKMNVISNNIPFPNWPLWFLRVAFQSSGRSWNIKAMMAGLKSCGQL